MTNEQIYNQFNRQLRAIIRAFSPQIRKALEAQYGQIAELIRVYGNSFYDGLLESITYQDLYQILVTLASKSMDNGKKNAESTIGRLDLNSEILYNIGKQNYIDTELLTRSIEMTKTTGESIKRIIQRGIKEGLSYSEISDNIVKESKRLSKERSLLITRTENLMANSKGKILAAQSLGRPLKKIWIASVDKRSRDWHSSVMNGKEALLSENFDLQKGNDMLCPGDSKGGAINVCNCRCTFAIRPV